jgi:sulfate/thiosulfate transport system ATP-binding protein
VSVLIRHVQRRFGAAAALRDIDLRVEAGEFVALLGPSGSGKTTLLRIMAGLDRPDFGDVWIDGQDMTDVPARLRRIGFVFQHYALFRHMTVFENVAFGLRIQRKPPSRAAIAQQVGTLLERMQIAELAARRPDQISGGQRQRVALARALAIQPRLLLLDEPFGALDAEVRKGLRHWLRGLHRDLGLTSVFVTHDQEEALELADRIAIMRDGLIVQYDTPQHLMDRPATPFVAGFLGEALGLPGEWDGENLRLDNLPVPPLPATLLSVLPAERGPVQAFVRPHEWAVAAGEGGHIIACHPTVRGLRLEIGAGAHRIPIEVPATELRPGDRCALKVLRARAYSVPRV